jgi:hypothetical protein
MSVPAQSDVDQRMLCAVGFLWLIVLAVRLRTFQGA